MNQLSAHELGHHLVWLWWSVYRFTSVGLGTGHCLGYSGASHCGRGAVFVGRAGLGTVVL